MHLTTATWHPLTVSQKYHVTILFLAHNFAMCWLTWKFLSPTDSILNLQLLPLLQTFYGPLSWYQKKHSPPHYPDHHPIFISFFHLPRSTASSLFNLRAWQSFCTTSLQVVFGLTLGLDPSSSYSIHIFAQSVSSFRNTCPYHCSLFCCSTKIISSIPSLSTLYLGLVLLP